MRYAAFESSAPFAVSILDARKSKPLDSNGSHSTVWVACHSRTIKEEEIDD